jgi:hypothetical protein
MLWRSGQPDDRAHMFVNENEFRFFGGPNTQVFQIEQLVWGMVGWPGRCRLKIPATSEWEARRFYGRTCLEVAEKARDFFASHYARGQKQRGNAFWVARA